MRFHRRNVIASDGERFSLLVDDNGLPDFWTTLYLTTHARSSKHDTTRSYINHLIHFKVWEALQGETIQDRILRRYREAVDGFWGFATPSFITVEEAQAIGRHCKLTTKAARRATKVKKSKNVLSLQAQLPVSRVPDPVVSVFQHRNRLAVVAKYVEFVAQSILRNCKYYADCVSPIDSMKNAILAQKPSAQGGREDNGDPDSKAPPPEVFEEVMRLVDSNCSDNPFTGLVKKRNSLLFRILYETGMRSGEVLQLKVEDIKFSKELISVVRRHDDPEDKYRAIEPNAKTLGRDLPVPKSLIDDIRSYILHERSKINQATKHSFLFVSYKGPTKGLPLSMSQFAKIVQKISSDESLISYIILNGLSSKIKVKRHGFRHSFNNRISVQVDEKIELHVKRGGWMVL
jgi:integrase